MAAASPAPSPPLPAAAVPLSAISSLFVPTPAAAERHVATPIHGGIEAPVAEPASPHQLVSLPTYRGVGAGTPAASRDEPEEALLSLLRLPQDAALASQLCLSAWLPNGAFALAALAKVRRQQDVSFACTRVNPTHAYICTDVQPH